jgi:condensin complex subunit 3
MRADEFWTELTPEKAFFVRVFVDRCILANDEQHLESILPSVTALAFRIQIVYNGLLEDIQAEKMDELMGDLDDRENREEARLEKEFIVTEMCKLAVNLDYADEIGRRKMFQLVREYDALGQARCVDVAESRGQGT